MISQHRYNGLGYRIAWQYDLDGDGDGGGEPTMVRFCRSESARGKLPH